MISQLLGLPSRTAASPGKWPELLNAVRRAVKAVLRFDLDVKLVSYGTPSNAILQIAKDFA